MSTAPILDPTDEGELEIERMATTPALYSTGSGKYPKEPEILEESKDSFLKSSFWFVPSEYNSSNGNH